MVISDATVVIHSDSQESLDAREQRELEEAIAMSLTTASNASDDSPRPAVETEVRRKAPPPTLASHTTLLQVPTSERPTMRPFGSGLLDPIPLPPPESPTPAQREAAHLRIASLPVLFPPTGTAWMQSPLAQPKAPPPARPPVTVTPDRERWYYFPTVSIGDQFPLRGRGPLPPVIERSDDESDNNTDHDAHSSASTAPSLSEPPSDWD